MYLRIEENTFMCNLQKNKILGFSFNLTVVLQIAFDILPFTTFIALLAF